MDDFDSRLYLDPHEQALLTPSNCIKKQDLSQIWDDALRAFNHWLKVPEKVLKEILQMSSVALYSPLTIDDITDGTDIKSGIPGKKFQTANSALLALFLGLNKMLTFDHDDAFSVVTGQLLELMRGQGIEVLWRDAFVCPSEEQYQSMVEQKAGGFIGVGLKLMELYSSCKMDLEPLLKNLVLYSQIANDYASLKSPEMASDKEFAEDLTEGKFSFPIIHGINAHPEDDRIMSILKQRTKDADLKRYCIEHLESLGSFDYTISTLRSLEKKMFTQIDALGGNKAFEKLIYDLSKKCSRLI